MVVRQAIGTWRGVAIDVAGWDGVAADVDLSCACMFEREVAGKAMTGGLLHLDRSLDGALSRLRTDGFFTAHPMETMLISRPPAAIAARDVLVVGLGSPQQWEPSVTSRAVAVAVQVAVQRGARTAAFAPSLLDAGLEQTGDTATMMMAVLANTLDAVERLAVLGLADRPRLISWTFDAGIAHLDAAARSFRSAFAGLSPS